MPFEKVTVDDWFDHLLKYSKKYKEIVDTCHNIRHEGRHVRDSAHIETKWSLQVNNNSLINRYKEIQESTEELSNYAVAVKTEIEQLKSEKRLSQREIELLHDNFSVTNDCLKLRHQRNLVDMCADGVNDQLQNELNMLEKVNKLISDSCEEADSQIIQLLNMEKELKNNIDEKQEALNVERDTLNISGNVHNSYKPEIHDLCLNYTSYESWLKNCENLKNRSLSELENSRRLRNNMCGPRERAHNEIKAQYDMTNFAFRKRIYEYRAALDELQWEKQNLQKENEHLLEEINKLEDLLREESTLLNTAELQNANRIYRPMNELCLDKCTFALQEQVFNFQKLKQDVSEKLTNTRNSYVTVQCQINNIEVESTKKSSDMTIDMRCLDMRQS